MAVQTVTFSQIDQTLLQQTVATYVQLLREKDATIDLNPASVLRQLVTELQALFGALNQTELDRLLSSWSLLRIMEDPTLADDDLVDALVSNYLIVRGSGTAAAGRVVLVMSSRVTTPIAGSTTLLSGGVAYTVTGPFLGVVSSESIMSTRDRLIVDRADGTSAFAVDVVAADVGVAGAAKKGAPFTLDPEVPNLVTAYAEADFPGGTDKETNEQLTARLAAGVAARSTADRVSITGLIQQSFPTVSQVSIIGFLDPEMNRDRYNFMGVSTGGKADIYVRAAATPIVVKMLKTATLESKALQRWRLQFTRDEAPGYYRIDAVLPAGSQDLGSLEIVSDTRGLDRTVRGGLFVPQIQGAVHGAFSPFQTSTVLFVDTATPVASLVEGASTKDYDVYVLMMPALGDIQSGLFSSRSRKDPTGDYLVRAPIPCMTSVSMRVKYDPRTEAPDVGAIQRGVAAAVNAVDFSAPDLAASRILDAVRGAIGPGAYVELPLDMRGSVLLPDGTSLSISGDKTLTIPEVLEQGVSRRTTAYFMAESAVDVGLSAAAVRYT